MSFNNHIKTNKNQNFSFLKHEIKIDVKLSINNHARHAFKI